MSVSRWDDEEFTRYSTRVNDYDLMEIFDEEDKLIMLIKRFGNKFSGYRYELQDESEHLIYPSPHIEKVMSLRGDLLSELREKKEKLQQLQSLRKKRKYHLRIVR